MSIQSLLDYISVIPDIRQQGKVKHKLSAILFLTVCAVIAGADEWQEIEDFGHERLEWLKKYGDFDNGIPVDDTIARVVSNIDSLAFEKMFIEWMQECHEITDGEIIAIDGKTIRGSFDKGKRKGAIHMVSAFSNENGVVLGQVKTEAKSNEITAIPELLNLLYLKKNLITIDAMGCQKDIASKIKDKKADYLGLGKEDNPALGYRAIRICLEQPDIFKTQLRALLRAAKYGNLSIMYPMIISVEEVVSIKKIVAEVAEELENENIPYEIPEQGIMIETPAAVMLSEELAELVDFFSIGTNDLTQYTLAIDRQNNRLDRFYNPHHEAVLRMIEMTVQGAHKHGKWVGICGELGADTTLTERFIKMGIDELSVSPSMVLGVRSRICEME